MPSPKSEQTFIEQTPDSTAEDLQHRIVNHQKNAVKLRRQSDILRAAARGFNTAAQKAEALKLCDELNIEASAENKKAAELTAEFIANQNEK